MVSWQKVVKYPSIEVDVIGIITVISIITPE